MSIGPDGTGVVKGYHIGPGADLAGADLTEADLTDADLTGADLSDADLRGAVLENVTLKNVNLSGADLRRFRVIRSSLSDVDFGASDLREAYFDAVSFINNISFNDSNLLAAYFNKVSFINNISFNGANLRGVTILISGSNMLGVSLKNAVLNNASILVWPIGYPGAASGAPEEFISGRQINEAKSIKALAIAGLGADRHILKGINFSYKNVAGLQLSRLEVQGADFYGADLRGAEFRSCNIIDSDFSCCQLSAAVFSGNSDRVKYPQTLVGCSFNDAFLQFSKFSDILIGLEAYGRAESIRTNSNDFRNARLEGAIFSRCSILVEQFDGAEADYADLDECELFDRNLARVPEQYFIRERDNINGLKISPGAHLERADLSGQDLRGVDLTSAHLEGANLSHADLSFSSLKDADLEGAHLDHAFLRAVDIDGATLRGADLRKSRITSAAYEAQKIKEGAKLRPTGRSADDMIEKSWRRRVRGADFSDADLSGAHIGDIYFSGREDKNNLPTNLKNANFYDTDLDIVVFDGTALPKANFKNSRISQSRYIDADLSGAEFDNSYIHRSYLEKVNLAGASFRDAKIDLVSIYSDHYDDADFSGGNISSSNFYPGEYVPHKHADLRKAKFKGATIDEETELGRPNRWPPSLKKYFAPFISAEREKLDAIIINDPRYIGVRNGLWVHQTHDPKTKYRVELCVSPYEEGEGIMEGRAPYGVVFEGAAPYFNTDVWSTINRFGMIEPGEDPDNLPTTKYKEGFLDTNKAKIVRLNVLEGFERAAIIKKFKAAGIPIYLVKDEGEKDKIGELVPKYLRERALKMTDYDEKSGRLANPGIPPRYRQECCVCGQAACTMDGGGHLFCEDCF